MSIYLIHGGFAHKESPLNDSFHKRIAEAVPAGGTLLCVYFARAGEEFAGRFENDQKLIGAQANGKDIRYVCASQEGFVAEVKKADAVYIGGGNPRMLLDTLQNVPEVKRLLGDKFVAGSSSGAFALSTHFYSHVPSDGVYPGLGLLPIRVVCHYESETHEGAGAEAVDALEACPKDLELVLLKDFEWREFSA